MQRHWEALETLRPGAMPWREVRRRVQRRPGEFQERHYKEFVTFLPYVQRFLYGANGGPGSGIRQPASASMRVFRRDDVAHVRLTFAHGEARRRLSTIAHVDLYFFLRRRHRDPRVRDVRQTTCPLDRAQDTLFRFGRAYPAFWDERRRGAATARTPSSGLTRDGRVLAASDYEHRAKYLAFVARYRAPRIASHWEFLLKPLVLEYPGQTGPLRYRQLEYYRMPLMAYLAVDDPDAAVARRTSCAWGWSRARASRDTLPYSARHARRFRAASTATTASGAAPARACPATRAASCSRPRARGRRPPRRLLLRRRGDRPAGPVPAPVLPAVPDRALPQGGAAARCPTSWRWR